MRRPRYGDMPIWAKLLVPFVILMFVWGFFGTLILVRSRDREARTRSTAELTSALDVARAAFADEEASLLDAVRVAGRTPGLADAIVAGNADEAGRLLAPLVADGRHSTIALLNRSREIVAVAGAELGAIRAGTERIDDPAVRAAAAGSTDIYGDKFIGLFDGAILIAGPVAAHAGSPSATPAGVVVVADPAARVAARMARGTGVRITLFAGDTAFASHGPALPHRVAGSGVRARVDGGDEPFEVVYAPLTVRGRTIGTIAVGHPTRLAMAGVEGTAAILGILVGFAVAAAIGIGIVTARAVTVPVGRLIHATRALEHGDLSARAMTDGRDEIGRLADSFNRMAGELQAGHAELERIVEERTGQLRRANEEMARSSAAKSSFLAAMSHELRTPLNAVIGYADMLADPELGRVPRKQAREMAANILVSGRHLLTVINDVLDLGKIEAGKIEVDPRPCDLGALLGEVRDVVRPLAAGRRIFLSVAAPPGLPAVLADPARTRQILFNLIANAIKFSDEQGHVGVTVGTGTGAEDGRIVVSVADDGPGLTADEVSVIFEPYERAGRGAGFEGTGLGLALVRSFVQRQGGRVWVESEPSRGSTFHFSIPAADGARSRAGRPGAAPSGRAPTQRVKEGVA